ncbi:hypothetical protein ACTFIW_008298 [Dictyostelium discoideum]
MVQDRYNNHYTTRAFDRICNKRRIPTAKIGGAAVGGAAVVAGGYAGYQAAAEANFGRQLGNWAKSISKDAWEKSYGAWKEGAKKTGNYARQGAREGYETWEEGAKKTGNYARQGAEKVGNNVSHGAREGYEAWKEGAQRSVDLLAKVLKELVMLFVLLPVKVLKEEPM